MQLHLVIMNLGPIPVGCIAGVMISVISCICHKVPLCLQGHCVAFDKIGVGGRGGVLK